ncbi:MAG: polysaccharide biosynthesis/export family protein [Crocinitomicaceae bacterium]|nr:polysaccharide biosynthesis/export family protein [Crocinitomicaceae bacterium]
MKKLFYFTLFIALLASCNVRKNVVYFQTEDSSSSVANYTPTFKVDDFLNIVVMADSPEAAIPFNLPPMTGYTSTTGGYSTGNPERSGYLIDENGNINLPIIGQFHIAGLKRTEAVAQLEEKLKSYISNPVVNIQILNFKVTVLGDVRSPGTYKIPNERITLLEAIGLSGDLQITGNRKNVLVIRSRGDKKEQYRLNLTKSEAIFNSPVYYLEQNDVVYVEPNISSRTNGAFWKTSAPVFISTAGVIISTISVISVLSK